MHAPRRTVTLLLHCRTLPLHDRDTRCATCTRRAAALAREVAREEVARCGHGHGHVGGAARAAGGFGGATGERRAGVGAHAAKGAGEGAGAGKGVGAGEGVARASTGIWLHSLRYALPGLGLSFESALPRFACEDFDGV